MELPHQPPLFGFQWNEAEANRELNKGLITVVAFDLAGRPHAVGTAFVISRQDRTAICATAAHVLLEVRRLQAPPARHAASTLREFLPPPNPIDLDKQRLFVISVEGERVEPCVVEGIALDAAADIAFLSIALQDEIGEPFFNYEYRLAGKSPVEGELICTLSYGDLGAVESEHEGMPAFKVQSRPVMRVGRVLGVYPHGNRLCRGPCIETSIPVYSGMSGGPVFLYGERGQDMMVVGLVCSDPDVDGEQKMNRHLEGRSVMALLPFEVRQADEGKRVSTLTMRATDFTGAFASHMKIMRPVSE